MQGGKAISQQVLPCPSPHFFKKKLGVTSKPVHSIYQKSRKQKSPVAFRLHINANNATSPIISSVVFLVYHQGRGVEIQKLKKE
jgi:hypothetical protein